MACDGRVESKEGIQAAVLIQLLVINGTMLCVEAVAGILANSSALLADSLDMFADAAIYGIALYAVGKAHSAKRRAALTSGIFQGVLGLSVAGDVFRRFLFGSEPTSLAMIAVGLLLWLRMLLACGCHGSNAMERFTSVLLGFLPELMHLPTLVRFWQVRWYW